MQKAVKLAAAGLVLMAAACDAPTSTARTEIPSPAQSDLQVVARSVALALQNDAARAAVRDALRDSPWDEHKVGFQEFLATDAGRVLLNAAAAAGGESTGTLLARAARLPRLELYVPSRDQRLAWRGTADVAVAATLRGDGTTSAGYDAAGRSLADPLNARAGAVLLLAPAEFTSERMKPQPRGVGDVIQSAGDGEQGHIMYTWTGADGTSITARYQDLLDGKDPRFVPVTSHTSGDVTRLEEIAGFMNDPGDLELAVRARFITEDGYQVGYATWTNPGVPHNTTIYPRHTLFAHVVPQGGNARVHIDLWEFDNCSNFCDDDDSYGTRDFKSPDQDVTHTILCQNSSVCTPGAAVGNVKLHWHTRAASVFTSVQVSANNINVGQYGYASARVLDQYGYGLTGYSASSWSIADPSVASLTSTGATSAQYVGNAAGYTTISATINGVTASAGFEVFGTCDPTRPWEIC